MNVNINDKNYMPGSLLVGSVVLLSILLLIKYIVYFVMDRYYPNGMFVPLFIIMVLFMGLVMFLVNVFSCEQQRMQEKE